MADSKNPSQPTTVVRRRSSKEVTNDLVNKIKDEVKQITSDNLVDTVTAAMKFVGSRANSFLLGREKKTIVIEAVQTLLPPGPLSEGIKATLPNLIDNLVDLSKGKLVINEKDVEGCLTAVFSLCGCGSK
jgi:hypothetical protein